VRGKASGVAKELTFLQTAVFIWLWASVCEEVFVRGLIQTALAPRSEHGSFLAGIRISAGVLIDALYLRPMHFVLLAMTPDLTKAIVVVLFAVVLSLVDGYVWTA